MKFGTHLEGTQERFLATGPSHISLATKMAAVFKWPPPIIIYQYLRLRTTYYLNSDSYSYNLMNGECSGTVFNVLATTQMAPEEQKFNIR